MKRLQDLINFFFYIFWITKILGMQKEITNLHGEICNKTSELQKLQSIIKHLQNDVDNLNAEIQDRDDLLLLKVW